MQALLHAGITTFALGGRGGSRTFTPRDRAAILRISEVANRLLAATFHYDSILIESAAESAAPCRKCAFALPCEG